MLRQINELYEETIKAGKKVSEILISYIGYDHLKSELNNHKDRPEWLDRLKVTENIRGVQIVPQE
ncbi:hypothetical protein [Taibaiella helva]|uniref:hypothetical protein n=1 Tax=Taibaiella helva TaxID=2301235 RepID=UPI000E58C37A|nr:hypothetical protein [Taibaiella helva]